MAEGEEKGTTNTNNNTARKPDGPSWTACATVSAAVITAIATITVAMFGSPVIIKWLELRQTPTPINTATTPSFLTTQVFVVTETMIPDTSKVIVESTPTFIKIIPTNTLAFPATSGLPVGIDVQMTESQSSGKAPISVKFDAKSSFYIDLDGITHKCQDIGCNYTWYVYFDGKLINKPERSSEGTLAYTFTKKGAYRIVVKICRGSSSDCAYDGTDFTAN